MRTIYKAHKFRIYPNAEQKQILARYFGTVRYVYNQLLNYSLENEKGINQNEGRAQIIAMKIQNEWLNEIDTSTLDYVLKHAQTAYSRYFNNQAKHPVFHTKNGRQSFTLKNTNDSILLDEKYIELPIIGKIKGAGITIGIGRLLNATISKESDQKYYASVLFKEIYEPINPTTKIIGIDKGIKEFLVTSEGQKISNPNELRIFYKKLRKEQRKLSRKIKVGRQKGKDIQLGKNIQKQKIKIARIYQKMIHKRDDFLQKLSTQLINEYDIICVEDLEIKQMLQQSKQTKSISEMSWAKFQKMLDYKANWNNKRIVKINKFYASSQICHNCKTMNKNLKDLSIRIWTCPVCGMIHDRDINAAINIKNEGLRQINK